MNDGKILLVANNFPPVRGGSAVVYHNIAKHAADRILVVAPKQNYTDGLPLIGWREHDRSYRYRVMRLPLLRTLLGGMERQGKVQFLLTDFAIRIWLLATVLYSAWREGAKAICIGELVPSGWLIHVLARITSLRIIVYVHGEEITTYDDYDPVRAIRRRTLLAADRTIVVSRFTHAAVLSLLGAAAERKIFLIENGVDLERFKPEGKRPDLVELYKLQGCFVFVTVCRLLEKKGIDNTLRAIALEQSKLNNIRYLIVGSGEYRETLEALVNELGISNLVVFSGQVGEEELVPHYCLGDAFVMPNRELANGDTEGFGLVFLEANACGLPVISGKDGGSLDAVQDGISGLVVDGKSVAEIAAAMVKLRHLPELRERLQRGGRQLAAEADWRRKVGTFMNVCLD